MASLDWNAPAVVLKAHHGSLSIARSLGRFGAPVHLVHSTIDHPAFASRYVARAHRWDFGTAPADRSIEFLRRLGRELGGPSVLIPTSDDTAELVADHADELKQWFVFQDNPAALVRGLSNKRELHRLALEHGIPTADTTFPESVAEVEQFARTAVFPVMLKASDGLRLQARTGKKMVIARTADELIGQYRKLDEPGRPNLMLQEYIPGGDDTIWMFDGYFDDASECVFGVTGKKLRQFPVHVGATSLGICLANPTVHRLTCDFMRAIGYRGILDIGFRYDARDGRYKLLDPNPRIGQTYRLFASTEGWDVAHFLYLDLTGQPLPDATPWEARRWLVEDWDLESSVDYLREGSLTVAEWIWSFQGVEELAWFAADDPRPAGRVARGFGAKLVAALGRRFGSERTGLAPGAVPASV